jgi:hypothetical protein
MQTDVTPSAIVTFAAYQATFLVPGDGLVAAAHLSRDEELPLEKVCSSVQRLVGNIRSNR